jgi:hypothetical protein
MGHMYVGHKKIIVANSRYTRPVHCAAIKRAVFPHSIPITNHKLGRFTAVVNMLWRFANRTELIDFVISTDSGWPTYNNMRAYPRVIANLDPIADDRKRADFNIFP